ncbi:hypothetical protein SI65_06040 [Aspergillus cristatus]|uniref:DUF4470 domain-containing protein n=1 Tax=Aspergillus cristatus TaxID=573508 RepID=A0A1E3BB60_ASPCR|nr:hypothetical protein SI65_06040 [Aspergillus cristatus]
MVTPTHLLTDTFFYAIGNTPAINLTSSVPPDQDADILLLGCGDVRNILFSIYMGMGNGRRIDFTCCDIQPEIIARNIILFTLILDDTGGDNVERIWSIYYHFIVDDASLNTLRKQASKLLKEAATATEWNKTRYGAILRFCDSYTFSQVLKLWKFYALQPSHGQSFKKQQEKLRNSTKKANEIQRDIVGDKLVYTGLRSAAPQMNFAAVKDVANSYKTFWRTGSSKLNQARTRANRNPMFGTTDSRHILHYGTDPVIGYHLSTAYAELSEDSPLKTDASKAKKMGACFSMAFEQFRAFTKALRKSASYLTLRFVITDAMALCHTFQHMQIHESSNSAGWYRSFRTWQPLVLDNRDYFAEGTNTVAPLSFDVIDTSNLMDHLGCLNLLTAAGPLLKPIPTSTLSTEVLVPREENMDEFKKNLLFGDIPTVALLLSLNPVENWTGATSRAGSPTRQSQFILHWKSTAIYDKETANPSLSFESKELAGFLFQVYKRMFSNENPTGWLSGIQDRLQRQAYAHYTRSSFVAILSLIRRRNMVVWDDFMRELYDLILNDPSIKFGASYVAEMIAYLDVLGLRPMPDTEFPSRLAVNSPQCPLQHWEHVPSSLCVTMIIPREKLRLFERASSKGGPVVQMVLRDMEMDVQSFYLNIQAGFGHLRVLGERYSEDLALEIEEDRRNWDGTAPMIVSAVVPSWVVLQKVDLSTEVIFALNQSLYSFAAFGNKLGLELAISKSTLASEDVYITKNRPNMSTHVSFSGISSSPSVEDVKHVSTTSSESDKEETQTQFHARLTTDQSKLESIMAHIDILPGQLQNVLQSGAGVKAIQSSLFEVSISFDTGTLIKKVQFPTPISMNGSKTLVAQKPSYIEFIAPVPPQKEISHRPDSLYPMVHGRTFVGLRTPHYVLLDKLPILSRTNPAGMSWLLPHLSDMFSLSGHDTQEIQVKSGSRSGDVRVNFKDSLLALFSCATGMNGVRRHDVLALNSPEEGGVHMLIFVSSLRLDMSCQHVVLDVAVLPLSLDTIPKMVPLLNTVKQRGFLSITVDKSELLQWKHALPAMVERCRDWNHKPSCEYLTSGKVPVSVEFRQQPLCSCGKGRFPRSYKTALPGIWKEMSKHAVRAAIAPVFPYPSLSTNSSSTNQLNRVRGKFQGLLMALLKRLRR